MPTLSGNLKDVTGTAQPGWQPELWFQLDRPHVLTDGGVRNTEPVIVTPAAGTGAWSVDLDSTEAMDGDAYYVLTVHWLSPSGGTALRDAGQWKIRIPRFNIDFGEAAGGGFGTGTIYESPAAPDAGVPAQYQLNTVTGDLFERTT